MGSTAINPNFTQQNSRPLPILFGYGLASGDTMIPFVCTNGAPLKYVAFADGECDGIEQYTDSATGFLSSTRLTPAELTPWLNAFLDTMSVNFHAGRWTPIGLPTTATSAGSDQSVDSYFSNIPSLTPPQSFSGICYAACYANPVGGIVARAGYVAATDITFYGILRGARCRIFDATGTVIGYCFTTNPTWHMIEAILRLKIKREQPQCAGLTPAEKACFNWPAIAAHAAYNDAILASGQKRFTGNYVFAAKATLTSMLETMLRCCQSYPDDADGKIGFYHFKPVYSSFALTQQHLVPGTWRCEKKDLVDAPNVFIPNFRDMNIQALVPVTSVRTANDGSLSDGFADLFGPGVWGAMFSTGGQNPFQQGSVFFYGDGSNPALNHDFMCSSPPGTGDPSPAIFANCPGDLSALGPLTSNGGYIGVQTSRFGPRSPNTVQHSRHQLATGTTAPGISAPLRIKPVTYDYGNMSYDQANRLAQFQMNSQLGNDVDGWTAPMTGSMSVHLEAVDANGNAFVRMRPHQRFSIDATVSPELAAQGLTEFLINAGFPKIKPPSTQSPMGSIDIEFRSYNPNAFTDTSYAPDSSLQTIASAALKYVNGNDDGMTTAWAKSWIIQMTPTVTVSGSTLSVTIPDLAVQFVGVAGVTQIGGASFGGVVCTPSWTGVPTNTNCVLWMTNSDLSDLSLPPRTAPTFYCTTNGTEASLRAAGTIPPNALVLLAGNSSTW